MVGKFVDNVFRNIEVGFRLVNKSSDSFDALLVVLVDPVCVFLP